MSTLSNEELRIAVRAVASTLDDLEIEHAFMGGAAVSLLLNAPERTTEDLDLVIHVDSRGITADQLTGHLLQSNQFAPIDQYGHTVPAYRLQSGTSTRLVEVEVFDYGSWLPRPQYDLQRASRTTINVNGQRVKLCSTGRMLREKILAAYQRQSGRKEETDINDVTGLLSRAKPRKPELDFHSDTELQAVLPSLLEKGPDLRQELSEVIKCRRVLNDWYVLCRLNEYYCNVNDLGETTFFIANRRIDKENFDRPVPALVVAFASVARAIVATGRLSYLSLETVRTKSMDGQSQRWSPLTVLQPVTYACLSALCVPIVQRRRRCSSAGWYHQV